MKEKLHIRTRKPKKPSRITSNSFVDKTTCICNIFLKIKTNTETLHEMENKSRANDKENC